jgi:nitroreductase
MTETIDVIKRRYSCRQYSDQRVDPAALRQIAEAAVCAPSAINRQLWRIIAIDDPALLDEMNAAGMAALQSCDPAGYERVVARGGKFFYDAPALIIIAAHEADDNFPVDLDTGIVASHIALAAESLSVNSCISAMVGALFQEAGGTKWEQRLGFPDGFHFGLAVLLGHEGGVPRKPHVPDLEKISMISG